MSLCYFPGWIALVPSAACGIYYSVTPVFYNVYTSGVSSVTTSEYICCQCHQVTYVTDYVNAPASICFQCHQVSTVNAYASIYTSLSISASLSLLFGLPTFGVLMPKLPISLPGVYISTPGVSISTPAAAAAIVVFLEYSMGILLRSSKLRSLTNCASMVVSSSTHLTTYMGVGTMMNFLRVVCFPVFNQRKV